MPYTGPDDDKLPENVKKLSAEKRKKWAATWNSVYNESGDEGKAFRVANGTIEQLLEWRQGPW